MIKRMSEAIDKVSGICLQHHPVKPDVRSDRLNLSNWPVPNICLVVNEAALLQNATFGHRANDPSGSSGRSLSTELILLHF
jgi:hypothetical protein